MQDTVAATPAVHALSAQVPAEQSRFAVGPAVQSCVAAPPPVQSVMPGETQVPAVHVPIPPHGTPPATPLPNEQTPEPLAVSPNGTRIGDAYLGFPLVPSAAMCNPPYFTIGLHYRPAGGAVKLLDALLRGRPVRLWNLGSSKLGQGSPRLNIG